MQESSTVAEGAYRLIAQLGQGGMADVYLAFADLPSARASKLTVVKKLRDHLAEDPEFVEMLLDEARITARLDHPNIVKFYDVARDGDTYFLVMEYLDGQPMHRIDRRIANKGANPKREIFYSVLADVLAAIHHAHEMADDNGNPLGIVHRDLSPQNVFVTYDGVVKVVDFGIAKALGRSTETRQGIVKGKLRYMSPEQAAGKAVDRRTDIFAAGVMLFNAAAGGKLWGALDDVAVGRSLVRGEYNPSPRAVRSDVPKQIDAICRKALSYRKDQRYQTADEMRADLLEALGDTSGYMSELATTLKVVFHKERAQLKKIIANASPLPSLADKAPIEKTQVMTQVMTVPKKAGLARSSGRIPTVGTASAPFVPIRDNDPRLPPLPSKDVKPPKHARRNDWGLRRGEARGLMVGALIGVLAAVIVVVALLLMNSVAKGATDEPPTTPRAPAPSSVARTPH